MAPLQFWKPGTAGPGKPPCLPVKHCLSDSCSSFIGSSLDRESEGEGGLLLSIPPPSDPSAQQNSRFTAPPSLTSQRTRLPIYKHREKLLYCVEKYGVVIVVGQTGCGKSTRKSSFVGSMSVVHLTGSIRPNRITAILARSGMVCGKPCDRMYTT